MDPEDAELLGRRSLTLHNLGRSDEALTDVCRAIELDPEKEWLLFNRATFYLALGRDDEARRDLARVKQPAAGGGGRGG